MSFVTVRLWSEHLGLALEVCGHVLNLRMGGFITITLLEELLQFIETVRYRLACGLKEFPTTVICLDFCAFELPEMIHSERRVSDHGRKRGVFRDDKLTGLTSPVLLGRSTAISTARVPASRASELER